MQAAGWGPGGPLPSCRPALESCDPPDPLIPITRTTYRLVADVLATTPHSSHTHSLPHSTRSLTRRCNNHASHLRAAGLWPISDDVGHVSRKSCSRAYLRPRRASPRTRKPFVLHNMFERYA